MAYSLAYKLFSIRILHLQKTTFYYKNKKNTTRNATRKV
nr:MAG TPA: hypothetical protein [Caudoviricetes sp.]